MNIQGPGDRDNNLNSQVTACISQLETSFGFKRERSSRGRGDKAFCAHGFAHFTKNLLVGFNKIGLARALNLESEYQQIVANAETRREMVRQLQGATAKSLESITYGYIRDGFLKDGWFERQEPQRLMQFLERFESRQEEIRGTAVKAEDPRLRQINIYYSIVLGGVSNVAHKAWNIQSIIPELFVRSYNRLPSQSEFRKVSEGIQPVLVSLASIHDDVFCLLYTSDAADE